MPDLTFIFAVLVSKDILTIDEARRLKKSVGESITSSNLGEMITKVEEALKEDENETKKIDAKTFLETS